MGILPQMAKFLVREHKHKSIAGDILLIGRQSVVLTLEQALALLESEDVKPRENFLHEFDSGNYITDRCFFSMLSPGRLCALDVSDYEEAEIIHDLNTELPAKYHNIADFIFNGSCLDN